ncbi:hypothetical protein NYQ43_18850 [Xanthomonas translucens pv. translucens]|uniref:hypothetical protein n=1 Tax=Xanthomonas campestris pv. translucens TaxID=343 RepID=UPI001F613B5E|nr:hypothetical protein [Xanthomonas translucens]MCT8287691.1 hypothetical protein [Xanthomonas translucens pv. translucens]MCT8305349.1 hypothetical protein [Xanthomonas translucens pv. translucens]UNT98750.1 hypothetical protein KBQ49_17590 [Xanthomonas translucens pv. translucens]
MKRTHLSVLLALGLLAGPALAAEGISKVNGSITAEAGKQYGDLETVNGGINVESGARVGNVETVNGGLKIADNAQSGGLSTVNGGIRVGQQVQIADSIETVKGGIFVDRGSRISGSGSVESVNGSIGLVATQLQGGIETVNGDITVGHDSHLGGGIEMKKPSFSMSFKPARKPRVIIGPRAVIDGPLHFEREVTLYVHRSAKTGPISGATAQPFEGDTAPEN